MFQKEFCIGIGDFTVGVYEFTPDVPGVTNALPEDCYPAEEATIIFDDKVSLRPQDLPTVIIPFATFVSLYACTEHGGDEDAAIKDIESQTITAIELHIKDLVT